MDRLSSETQKLDVAGMQKHSREHLEYSVLRDRSDLKAMMIPGDLYDEELYAFDTGGCCYDHPDPMPGIHYGYSP